MTFCHWQKMQTSPVVVSEKIFGLTLTLDFIDHCHSLASFFPPLAAVGSLPLPAFSFYHRSCWDSYSNLAECKWRYVDLGEWVCYNQFVKNLQQSKLCVAG